MVNSFFARLRDLGFKIRDRDAISPINETLRTIKNASEISRSGQNFRDPTFFEEPFYIPGYLVMMSGESKRKRSRATHVEPEVRPLKLTCLDAN